jgi:hypothetical protein
VRTVRYNYDGSCLAIGTEENNLTVVDPNSGETAFIVQTQTVPQYFSWHPTKNLLAYVGDKPSSERNEKRDGVIKLLEVKKKEHAP